MRDVGPVVVIVHGVDAQQGGMVNSCQTVGPGEKAVATVAGGNLVMFPNPLASESENLTREDSIAVSLFTNGNVIKTRGNYGKCCGRILRD